MPERQQNKNERKDGPPSFEEYLKMDDKQRDYEIEKGLQRLQKRIREILSTHELEKHR